MQKMENEIFVGRASSITGGGDGLSQPFRLREHGRESPSCGLGVPTSAGSVAFFSAHASLAERSQVLWEVNTILSGMKSRNGAR
jgi:hypothetical protein